jgi:hydroxymethylpyrimidine kinase/phosphomethylpyrimidine kinase/thiamine-phosphate diphosphorylase
MKPRPIIWIIAGSDSGGGAGIQADLHTVSDLGGHACTIVTALTAQNSMEVTAVQCASQDMINQQFEALLKDLPPTAVKIGMVGQIPVIQTLARLLPRLNCPIIVDPVMVATNGGVLLDSDAREIYTDKIIPFATMLTPNLAEAEILCSHEITTHADMEFAAQILLSLGAHSVLLKGGHLQNGPFCDDYWTDGKQSMWLRSPRTEHQHTHGAGCTYASAIATLLITQSDSPTYIQDALTIAKAYVTRGIRTAYPLGQGPGPLQHGFNRGEAIDFPKLYSDFSQLEQPIEFPTCDAIGFYPIVPDCYWLERVLANGAQTVQLRIKDANPVELAKNIQYACKLATAAKAKLFINDHWQLAIQYGAYGVHLGQEDLETADLRAIAQAGCRLGVSTHSHGELAHALAINPSYVAFGPIYPTKTKEMKFTAQGMKRLQEMRALTSLPLVAIGGLTLNHLPELRAAGVDGVAVISAILASNDPDAAVEAWLTQFAGDLIFLHA